MGSLWGAFKRTQTGVIEWYQESRRRQIRSWGLAGAICGFVWGKTARAVRMINAEFGDHVLITEYTIEKKNVPEFEKCWNDHAKITQRFDGYVGTKLFKALNRDWPEATVDPKTINSEDDTSENKKQVTEVPNKGNVSPDTKISSTTAPVLASTSLFPFGDVETHITEAPIVVPSIQRLPFQYLQVRMWRSPQFENVWRQDERVMSIVRKMEDLCTHVKTYEFGTIVDDKIQRTVE